MKRPGYRTMTMIKKFLKLMTVSDGDWPINIKWGGV